MSGIIHVLTSEKWVKIFNILRSMNNFLVDCIYFGKTENKFGCMKRYKDEKTPGLLRMILFLEIFANVKGSGF